MGEEKLTPSEEAVVQQRQKELSEAFDILFSHRIWDIAKYENEIFNALFVNRNPELVQFQENYRRTLLGSLPTVIIGRIGTGKSAFLHKIKNLVEQSSLFPSSNRSIITVLLDLEDLQVADSSELLLASVSRISERLKSFNVELAFPPIDPNTKAMHAVHQLADHLKRIWLTKKDILPHILFLLDDLDYRPQFWYDLVMGLRAILSLPFLTAIYAVRPLLAVRMFGAPDDRIQRMMADANKIFLSPLPVHEIIASRMQELVEGLQKPCWKQILSPVITYDEDFAKLLEKVGFRRNGKFQYPFAPKLEQFLEKSTNGNARLMLDMLKTCLTHILDHTLSFTADRQGVYHFKRALILKLFGDYGHKPIVNLNDSTFRSFNRLQKDKDGNPLLLNILEWIQNCEGNDDRVKEAFLELGHSMEDIKKGLAECMALELIEPDLNRASADIDDLQIQDYKLTPKGLFHLTHISTWSEYGNLFGMFQRRINRSYYTKLSPQRAMYTDIIEFLQYIVTAIHDICPAASELTISLTTLIKYYVQYQSTYLNVVEQEKYSPDNPYSEFMVDEPKLYSLFMNPPVPSSISSKRILVGKYVTHVTKGPHRWQVRFSIENVLSVARALRIALFSQLDIRERCDFQYFQGIAKGLSYK